MSVPPVSGIDINSLPSPAALLFEIIEYTSTEDMTIPELARLVERDPSLVARLLQIANSGFYSFNTEIVSVERAILVLGLNPFRILVWAVVMSSMFPKPVRNRDQVLNIRRRSLLAALIARAVLTEQRDPHADEGFLIGLMTGIGPLAVYQTEPVMFDELFRDGPPDVGAQRAALGVSFDGLSGQLLQQWGFPPRVADAVTNRAGCPPVGGLQGAICVGSLAGDIVFGDEARAADALVRLRRDAAGWCNLSGTEVLAVIGRLGPMVESMASVLGVELPAGIDIATVVADAAGEMQRLSTQDAVDAKLVRDRVVELESSNSMLSAAAMTDELTGLGNRRGFDRQLAHIAGRPRSFGVLLIDVDWFKTVNDQYGHLAGDEVLRRVAGRIAGTVRAPGFAFRYGGEEFAVLVPDCDVAQLAVVADRVRTEVAGLVVPWGSAGLRVTVSVGGAVSDGPPDTGRAGRVLGRADQLLYDAKQNGRNRSRIGPAGQ